MAGKKQIWLDFPMPTGARRVTPDGRHLHCCCVCGKLEPWSKGWSWYGSYKDLEDCTPVKKFCSDRCRKQEKAVTPEMAADARRKEHHEEAA